MTVVVMALYMACFHGCCWFRNAALIEEYKTVLKDGNLAPKAVVKEEGQTPASS
eukprot:CAMPEP_0197939108 /NCGR_PEP_ID=MMETSP1439-20131203/119171_1 /TAXON_ID=66791 /ORGANISM="Gonyaulax spinifera, Strain CCMP409" /LENGTH=53 /DNA_ID=CAMNT_0043562213 /DNA_START=9 /DNA_END=166 /DNA_ORIENTATION=-